MSLKKPIIIVRINCLNCRGSGNVEDVWNGGDRTCPICSGSGEVEIKPNHPNFKTHYIDALTDIINDRTKSYRKLSGEANKYLKEARKYCKELDKVVNKEDKNAKKR